MAYESKQMQTTKLKGILKVNHKSPNWYDIYLKDFKILVFKISALIHILEEPA